MNFKIFLAIMWANLCMCERQKRSTVLTDESKRILEHFDFSNFDKQEALNYLDRQRYENQIRGKRSHSKFKRDHNEENENSLECPGGLLINRMKRAAIMRRELPKPNERLKPDLKSQTLEKDDPKQMINSSPSSKFLDHDDENQQKPETVVSTNRSTRGHRSKKKHRSKSQSEDEEGENEGEKSRQKKKKKKKKRHYWDQWSEWSPCSVTCGRGRKIRWRKCIAKNCTTGELEMGEKTCQLPACNLFTKLLGL